MGLFNHFPYTNVHELNLDWILSMMKALEAEWEAFTAGNSLTFADPLQHDSTRTYAKNTIVIDGSGNAYVSLQAVPVGVGLGNQDYWLMVFDYEAFIEKVNKNFTARYYRGQYRATASMAIGDWLTVDDILCKATAAIAYDEVLKVGVNIDHFTLEDFIKAFMQSATQLIQQYKNDIDASELLYRQQLAQDIANTTSSLQSQLDAAIAGVTVDSEVINARVGADGVTYPTLGDAIRTQFEEILTWSSGTTAIVPNDDLDNFVTKGAYVKAPSTTPVSNLPPFITASTGFTMLVSRNSQDASNTNFMQIVIPNRDDHIYIRNHDTDGFTSWLPIMEADDRFNGAFATLIVPNDDLDTLVDKSCYAKAPSTTPVSNLPPFITASTGFFMMVVRNSQDVSNTNFMQIVIPNRDDHIYIRNHDTDGFTSWLPLMEPDDRFNSAYATSLLAGDDVNNVMSTGIYEATSAASNSIAHLPRTGGFTMIEMYANAVHNTLMQYIFYGGSSYSFMRFHNGSIWSDWMQLTGAVDIPQYWESTIATKNTSIDTNCATHGLTNDSFIFITDVHAPYVYPVFYKLLKYVIDHTPITKIFNAGDSLQDNSDGAAVNGYKALLNNLSFENDVMSVRGNHDTGHTNWFYGLMLGRLKDSIDMSGSLDYVYDVKSQKMRYIFIDCNDPNNATLSASQQTWLSNRITELTAGWTVLIITHAIWKANGSVPPTAVANYTTFQTVIDAIYDSCAAQIVGVLSGHDHQDYYETTTKGYLLISRTTPSYLQASTDPNNPTRTQGTTDEICFDGVTVDTTAGEIKFVRIGVGSDLTLTYNLKS